MTRACGFAQLAASAWPLPETGTRLHGEAALSATFIARQMAEREAIAQSSAVKVGFTQSQMDK